MWAYFLIIIATDKVINFKTTLFSSWSKWHYIEINSECARPGPGTQAIAQPVTASSSCRLLHDLQRWVLLLIGSGYYIRKSRAGTHDQV